MDFYYITYKRQYYLDNEWIETVYKGNKIIVIASSQEEAEGKIKTCLKQVETGDCRAIPVTKVEKCIGIAYRGFDGTEFAHPIKVEQEGRR